MEVLVGWFDPAEAAKLRAELEAAKADVNSYGLDVSNCVLDKMEMAKQLAAKDAEIEHLRRKLAGACESGLTHMGNAANYRRECVELQDELEAAKAEIERLNNNFIDLAEWRAADIAARDLVIQKMREAIIELNHFVTRVTHWEEGVYDRHGALLEAKQALSLQPDTAALDEYVAQAVKAALKQESSERLAKQGITCY